MSEKIYLVTYSTKDRMGNKVTLVSHGVGEESAKDYVLPPEPLCNFNPKRDEFGYYIT